MSLTNEERRDIKRDTNFLGGQAFKWIVIAVVASLLIGAALWFIGVAVSGPKGQGDAERERNSAQNWVQRQQEFQRRFNSIKAQDANIGIADAAVKRTPNDQRRQIELDGLVRNCNVSVGEYNSLGEEFNAEKFRDADLPKTLPDGPSTDCTPNQ